MLPYPDTSEKLLATAPERSPKWHFFRNAYDLVQAILVPRDRVHGFACILALEMSEVRFTDGRVLGVAPIDGGIEDWAAIIALCFAQFGWPPTAWKSGYPTEISNPRVKEAADEIDRKIPTLPIVESYRPWRGGSGRGQA